MSWKPESIEKYDDIYILQSTVENMNESSYYNGLIEGATIHLHCALMVGVDGKTSDVSDEMINDLTKIIKQKLREKICMIG